MTDTFAVYSLRALGSTHAISPWDLAASEAGHDVGFDITDVDGVLATRNMISW